MVTLTIAGTPRTEVGKKAAKAVRRQGLIPCVLYGNKKDNIHFTVTPNEMRDLIYTGEFKLAELKMAGKAHKCLVKEIQFHPVKDTINHIDFLELEDGQTIKVEVPLRFVGVSPGVRSGGKFTPTVRKIKIKTRVENLVDEMVADISSLKLGEVIRVKDISPAQGIEIINPAALPVASVVIPRSLKGLENQEEEGKEETPAAEE